MQTGFQLGANSSSAESNTASSRRYKLSCKRAETSAPSLTAATGALSEGLRRQTSSKERRWLQPSLLPKAPRSRSFDPFQEPRSSIFTFQNARGPAFFFWCGATTLLCPGDTGCLLSFLSRGFPFCWVSMQTQNSSQASSCLLVPDCWFGPRVYSSEFICLLVE